MRHKHIHKKSGKLKASEESLIVSDDEVVALDEQDQNESHKRKLVDIQLKEDEQQDHLLIDETLIKSQIEDTSLRIGEQQEEKYEIVSETNWFLVDVDESRQLSEIQHLWLKDNEGRKMLQDAILDVWMDPKYLARKLREWIECAEMVGNDWTVLPDYKARLQYLKEGEKLLWYTKREPVEIVFRPITNPENPI